MSKSGDHLLKVLLSTILYITESGDFLHCAQVCLFIACYIDSSFDCKIALHINRPTFVFTNN